MNNKKVNAIVNGKLPTYQKVPLGDGKSTRGVDRSKTASKVLSADMSGMSVLDLGCNNGFFCLEAKKRGADKVVGVDAVKEKIEVAMEIARRTGNRVEYIVHNVETWDSLWSFDLVLLLNVIHHLNDPIGMLQRIYGYTKKTLVIEFPGFMYPPRAQKTKNRPFYKKLDGMSLISVTAKDKSSSVVPYRYLFSPEALKRVLVNVVGFRKTRYIASPFKAKEGRHIIFASK
jgi:predicted RNA methylase